MKAIISLFFILLFAPLSSRSQDSVDPKLQKEYTTILNAFFESTCPGDCRKDSLPRNIIYCDCLNDLSVRHRVDDANMELDSLHNFGLLLNDLLLKIDARKTEVKRDLESYEEMESVVKIALQSVIMKIDLAIGRKVKEKYNAETRKQYYSK